MALLANLVVRFLIPDYFSTPGLPPVNGGAFGVGIFVVVLFFFLPLLWLRPAVGYVGAIILGILVLIPQTMEIVGVAAAGALSQGIVLVFVPTYVFALLLIGSSVLAWREG